MLLYFYSKILFMIHILSLFVLLLYYTLNYKLCLVLLQIAMSQIVSEVLDF